MSGNRRTRPTAFQAAAEQALRWFCVGKNHEGRETWMLRDKRPDELFYAVYGAHGDRLPDDYVFAYFVESLRAFRDEGEAAEAPEPDVYTAELLRWVASNLTRAGFFDEVLEQAGPAFASGKDAPSFSDLLMRAQAHERNVTHEAVRAYLEAVVADMEGSE